MAAHKIHIANSKGGVGKTTFCVNLAAALSLQENSKGKQVKVLLVDADPQRSASTYLLGEKYYLNNYSQNSSKTLYHLFKTRIDGPIPSSAKEIIIGMNEKSPIFSGKGLQSYDTLHLLASHQQLSKIEMEIFQKGFQNNKVSIRTKKDPIYIYSFFDECLRDIEDSYDYILMDSPSNINFLNINALFYCDSVLIPLVPDGISLNGMELLLNEIYDKFEEFKKFSNKRRIIRGFVYNNWEIKLNAHNEYISIISNEYKKTWHKHLKEYIGDFRIHPGLKRSASVLTAYKNSRPIDDGSPNQENVRKLNDICKYILKGWKK